MSTTAEKLAILNALRDARQQPPLKSWKGSTKALDDTIEQYRIHKVAPAVAEGAYDNSRVAEHATGLKGTDEKKREAIRKANVPADSTSTKETTMSKPTKKVATQEKRNAASDKGLVSLADIARELKIEPKLARAKARRSTEITNLAQGDAWAFKPADAAKVKKILKG